MKEVEFKVGMPVLVRKSGGGQLAGTIVEHNPHEGLYRVRFAQSVESFDAVGNHVYFSSCWYNALSMTPDLHAMREGRIASLNLG